MARVHSTVGKGFNNKLKNYYLLKMLWYTVAYVLRM